MSLDAKSIRELIRSRGYWEVDIRPDETIEQRFESHSDCMKKVRESVVSLRGWDYPHAFSSDKPPYVANEHIEAVVTAGYYKAFWAMFLNGHFYHLFVCKEDWMAENAEIFGGSRYTDTPPGRDLSFLNTLYQITEIFEFAIRLAQKNVLGRKVKIKIALNGMKERKIASWTPGRFMTFHYECGIDNFFSEEKITINELIGKGNQIALDMTKKILERFNWLDVSTDMLREDQRKFLRKET